MITAIEIENLRGIRKGRLEGLAPLTILTGPNGCGKSTVLDALLIGASLDTAEAVIRAVQRHPVSLAGADWLFRSSELEARIWVATDSDQSWEYKLKRSLDNHKSLKLEATGWRQAGIFKRTFIAFGVDNKDGSVRTDSTTQAEDLGQFVRLIDPGIAAPLHETFSNAARALRKDQVEELLKALVPNFKRLEILTEGDTPFLAISTETSVAPVSLAGDGIQALVQIALEMAAAPGGLVLVEEPEVYQHPGAIAQTAKAILANVRRGVQIVLTTHSLELIDALLSEATEEDVAGMAVFNLLLRDGELRHGRRVGEQITFARQNMESDLR
ncbi:MAG: ATP-binding protein [Thermoanaerobaculia bacterium]|nr:ATP-binding protein [Thermoanaerobaculia bacterium]